MTLQGMMLRTQYMMDEIRRRATEGTFEKFKAATRRYYETCYGGDEVTRLTRELENLGVDPEILIDTDLSIRDEVFGL